MIKQYFRILIALIGVAGSGMAASGQVADHIVVKIPYEFTVSGKTLPAGTYSLVRASDSDQKVLILSSFENRTGVLVLPTEIKTNHGDIAKVSFEQVGDEHFLSKIETAYYVFTIPVSRAEILEAAARSHSGTSASGSSSGSN